MKKSTTLLSFSASIILSAFVAYGCGDDDSVGPGTSSSGSSGTEAGTSSSSGTTSSGADTAPPIPAVPTLGAQIDRFGRPAVNTAANNVFNPDVAAKGAAKDAYNQDSVATGWVGKYTGQVAGNLAIFDGLDRNCGNQAFAAKDPTDGGAGLGNIQRYGTLASVLTDDRQWMNTAGTHSATDNYLAVEANATHFLDNTDIGGRRLEFDVIDVTYSLLAAGAATGVGDTIPAIPAKTNGTTFPYLAAPVTQ